MRALTFWQVRVNTLGQPWLCYKPSFFPQALFSCFSSSESIGAAVSLPRRRHPTECVVVALDCMILCGDEIVRLNQLLQRARLRPWRSTVRSIQ